MMPSWSRMARPVKETARFNHTWRSWTSCLAGGSVQFCLNPLRDLTRLRDSGRRQYSPFCHDARSRPRLEQARAGVFFPIWSLGNGGTKPGRYSAWAEQGVVAAFKEKRQPRKEQNAIALRCTAYAESRCI